MKDGLHLDEAIKKGAVSASGSRIGSPSICCIRECRLVALLVVSGIIALGSNRRHSGHRPAEARIVEDDHPSRQLAAGFAAMHNKSPY